MKKKLLILGSTAGSKEIIEYARSRGVITIVADYYPPELSSAKQVADISWLVSTADVDQLEIKCREENVTAVLAGANDFNVSRAIDLCGRLNLPIYLSKESWKYSCDKRAFKKFCRDCDIPVAKDFQVSDQITEEEINAVKFPVVVKPTDSGGNFGLSICYTKKDLKEAYILAKKISPTGQVLVEALLDDKEFDAHYAMIEGDVKLIFFKATYNCDSLPQFCYTLMTNLTDYTAKYMSEANTKVVAMLKKMGCKNGYCFIQCNLDNDEFKFVEMGYRLDGETTFRLCKDMLGIDVIKIITDYALYGKTDEKISDVFTNNEKLGCVYYLWSRIAGKVAIIKADLPAREDMKTRVIPYPGKEIGKFRPQFAITFVSSSREEICTTISDLNDRFAIYNEVGENMIEYFSCFDKLPVSQH